MMTPTGNPVLDLLGESLGSAELTTETLDATSQALSMQRSPVRALLAQEGLPEKDFLKRAAKKISGFVYHEATVHNPPGDMLPDQIDDNMKGEIKKIVN